VKNKKIKKQTVMGDIRDLRQKNNKKAQLTQRERATAVHV